MTATIHDVVLAAEIMLVTLTLIISFLYVFKQLRELRSEVQSLREQVNTGDAP